MITGIDGIDHINVYSKGKTELGRKLSNFAYTPFDDFASVEGWWYWYCTGKKYEHLKKLYGFKAKQEGKKYDIIWTPTSDILKQVYHRKLECNHKLKASVISNSLPFTHYYDYSGKIVETEWVWTGELWNIIRDELKEKQNMNENYTKYNKNITTLTKNQVFIFGSNSTGFHGAGSAGQAFRGDSSNTWRKDEFFLQAIKVYKDNRIRTKGKWAIYGVPRGFQEGTEGKSYAICTIKHPGKKYHRSITRKDIATQLWHLWSFIEKHPELEFLLTPVGTGYSGYTRKEMKEIFDWVVKERGTPSNLKNTRCYDEDSDVSLT